MYHFLFTAPFDKFATHVAVPLTVRRHRTQKVREEKEAENEKHHEQLHQDDEPQGASPGHRPEALYIKTPDGCQYLFRCHKLTASLSAGSAKNSRYYKCRIFLSHCKPLDKKIGHWEQQYLTNCKIMRLSLITKAVSLPN